MLDDGQYLLSAKRTEVISTRLEFSVATGFAVVAGEGSFGDDPHQRCGQQKHYVEYGSGSPRNDKKVLLQIDDLDPVRLRTHRVVADRLQFAARLVDRVDRHRGRVHADRQQELASRVDREAARRLLGRKAADLGQGAFVWVDLVADQHTGPALGAVEKLAVRRHMDVRGCRLLLVFVSIDKLQLI